MRHRLKGAAVAAALAFGLGTGAAAQNIEWVDTVPVTRGGVEGFELRLRTDTASREFSTGYVLRGICDHFLPAAVPLVIERTEIAEPAFVAVTIVTRSWELVLGAGGRWQATYDIEDESCGREHLAARRSSDRQGSYLR